VGFLQKKWAVVWARFFAFLLGFLRVVLEKVVCGGWFFVVKNVVECVVDVGNFRTFFGVEK
jgi:hypothetical protein